MRPFSIIDASDAGIPQLTVATDRSLDEPHPVMRVGGYDEHGNRLFDHTLVAMWANQSRQLLRLVEDRMGHVVPGSPDHHDMRQLVYLLRAHVLQAGHAESLVEALRRLGEGEAVMLADEGLTRIRVAEAPPGGYEVYRWGHPIGAHADVHAAVAMALDDVGLPAVERLVA